jgi:hypothetical protein
MVIMLLLQLLFETYFTLGTRTLEMYIEIHVVLHVKCLLDLSHCKQNLNGSTLFVKISNNKFNEYHLTFL